MAWDPFEDLRRMHEEMNRMFNKIFIGNVPLLGHGTRELAKYQDFRTPIFDIKETENNVIAAIELPGADKEDIELNITENSIEVKVQKKAEVKKKDMYSFESKSFYRKMPLPAEVIADKATANYKNGILKVEIPKVKKIEKKKKIEIK